MKLANIKASQQILEDRDQKQLFEGKTQSQAINQIFGEVMSGLGKLAPDLSASAKKAIKDGLIDAYEAGEEAGYERRY